MTLKFCVKNGISSWLNQTQRQEILAIKLTIPSISIYQVKLMLRCIIKSIHFFHRSGLKRPF